MTEAAREGRIEPGAGPLEARLSLFTGKGGVGKSTVVAALAVRAAELGRRPLVVELGHRASMRAIFGSGPIGHRPVEVAEGVHAINFDFDQALLDYVAKHVKVRRLAQAILRSESLRAFFRAAPAVSEVLVLERIAALLEARRGGEPRWDPVLVDLDATGHALMFLSLPEVFAGLVEGGPLAELLGSFVALLRDPRTRLHLVTLPAELPVQETTELYAALRAKRWPPLGHLFLNRWPPVPLSIGEAQLDAIEARAEETGHAAIGAAIAAARRAQARRARAERARARLEKELPLPRIDLPVLPEPLGLEGLARLGRIAGGERSEGDRGA